MKNLLSSSPFERWTLNVGRWTFAFLLLCALCGQTFAKDPSATAQGKQGLRYVQIPLTAAQINGMYAAPVKILDPQGSGKSIVVAKAVFTITRTATQFANGGAAIIQYGSTVNGGGTQACDSTIAATNITGTAGTVVTVRNGAVITALAAASIQNAPLYLSNATAAFDTGTGTATLGVWYYVL